MEIYLLAFLSYILMAFIIKLYGNVSNIVPRTVYLVPFFLVFGSIAMLRSQFVGVDTKLYTLLFSRMQGQIDLDTLANSKFPLYDLYSALVFKINASPNTIIIFNSLIIIFGICLIIKRMSSNVFVSSFLFVSLYFYFHSLNISRQYIALVILWIGITFLLKDKDVTFFVYYLMACLVHSTAVVGIFIYVLYKIKWNKIKYFILAIIVLILPLVTKNLLNLFIKIFPSYAFYTDTEYGSQSFAVQGQGNKIYLTMFYACFLIIGFLIQRRLTKDTVKRIAFYNAVILVTVILGLIFSKDVLMTRIEFYFSILMIIYIPEVIINFFKIAKMSVIKKTNYINLTLAVVLLITLVPMVYQLHKGIDGVIPFSSFLN